MVLEMLKTSGIKLTRIFHSNKYNFSSHQARESFREGASQVLTIFAIKLGGLRVLILTVLTCIGGLSRSLSKTFLYLLRCGHHLESNIYQHLIYSSHRPHG
jgi:hypothetical protein